MPVVCLGAIVWAILAGMLGNKTQMWVAIAVAVIAFFLPLVLVNAPDGKGLVLKKNGNGKEKT